MKARIPKHREFIINFPDSIDQNKANEGWAKLQQIVEDYKKAHNGASVYAPTFIEDERVLEQVADNLAALVLRLKGDVLPAQHDAALVGDEPAGDGIEQGGLSRAVGTHDGGKVPGFHVQAHSVQSHLFVHGTGVESLMQVVQLQHFHLTFPPCR